MSASSKFEAVSFPEYPILDFRRDFDVVAPRWNDVEDSDRRKRVAIVREYIFATYPSPKMREDRGAVLGTCLDYLRENSKQFDEGDLAVAGKDGSLVTDYLLAAVYEVVGGGALYPCQPPRTNGDVRKRAKAYAAQAKRA